MNESIFKKIWNYSITVVSGIPAVERLIFDDRPVKHNLSWAVPEKS